MKNKKIIIYACSILLAVVFAATTMLQQTKADTLITTTLRTGVRGNDVEMLQTFLAKNPTIYPAGLVTGYFGTLTKSAVEQFQLAANLTADGIVGPRTREKINSYLSTNSTPDFAGPTVSGDSIQTTTTTATITWTTSENTTGKIYYNTIPLVGGDNEEQPYGFSLSGIVVEDTGSGTNHIVTLSNLNPHTTYYYDIVSVDAYGNTTVTIKNTFATN